MKKNIWQIQSAKNRFSELVKKAVNGEPQLVTKNGEPVVYVINVKTYNKQFLHKKKSKKNILLKRPHKDIDLDLFRDKDTGRNIDL